MFKRISFWQLIPFVVLALIVSGCKVALAPNYDKELVAAITNSSTVAMQFFASITSGTTNKTFKDRAETYAKLIGQFDALEIQARVRVQPWNQASEKIKELLTKTLVQIAKDPNIKADMDKDSPTAYAMYAISNIFRKMKTTDEKVGMTADEVAGFKSTFDFSMDQALTYENYLER
jgi:hypothetical protein